MQFDVIAVGPLVELHILSVEHYPRLGDSATVVSEEVLVGSDAPIVCATLKLKDHSVRLVSNRIGGKECQRLRAWLGRYCINCVEKDVPTALPRTIGISVPGTRSRTWFTPGRLVTPDVSVLKTTPSTYLYIDWYPEVLKWFRAAALLDATRDRRLWVNLSGRSNDEVLHAVSKFRPYLVQTSLRIDFRRAIELAEFILVRTSARQALVTLGASGSVLAYGEPSTISVVQRHGSGDSRTGAGAVFAGSFIAALLRGLSWRDAHQVSSVDAAAFVSGKADTQIPDVSFVTSDITGVVEEE